jgi:PAS domain S-box-containing protein
MFILGIFASLLLYNANLLHSTTDIQEIYRLTKLNVSYYLIAMSVLIYILFLYNGQKFIKIFFSSLFIILITFIINLILPHGLIYIDITGYKTLSFKWQESYYIAQGNINWFYEYLAVLFYLSLFTFLILSFFRLKKEQNNHKAIVFSILTGIFLLVNIYDVLIDLEILRGIFLTEMFMLPIILLLNFDIAYELRTKKLIESKFKRVERNFESVVEKVHLLVVGITPQGIISYSNPYFQQLTQYKPDELIGKEFLKIFIPLEIRDQMTEIFSGLLRGEDFFSYENPILSKNQTKFHIAWSNVLIESKDGKYSEVMCIGANNTERLQNRLELENAYEEIKTIKNKLEDENTFLRESLHTPFLASSLMVGNSNAMKYVHHSISDIAKSHTTVLIEGETGVGKELVAQCIQNRSLRKDKPFITVNCAALSRDLIESELFGHEKGAFTGAISQRKGRFELADGGTLFLDEVGELPLELQSKLLRVLQEGEIVRLGGQKTIKVDVRILTATNKSLKESVKNGTFRDDLYYRLSVYPITVPALTKRLEDIPALVGSFVHEFCEKSGREDLIVSMATVKNLQKYSWPGNIRELRNVIERAVITSREKKLVLRDNLQDEGSIGSKTMSMEEVEKRHILNILNQCNWKISGKNGAASILRLNEGTLRSRMKKLGIERN